MAFRDGVFTAAGARATTPVEPGFEVVYATGMTVIPGSMDAPTRLKMGPDDPWKVHHLRVRVDLDMPLTLIGIRDLARAQLARSGGFTMSRGAGDINHLGISLRGAIASGLVECPRIVACAENFSATGRTTDFLPDGLQRIGIPGCTFEGVDQVRSGCHRCRHRLRPQGSARLLRIERPVGTRTPHRLADVVVVDGDPLRDISILGIELVSRDGRVVCGRRSAS